MLLTDLARTDKILAGRCILIQRLSNFDTPGDSVQMLRRLEKTAFNPPTNNYSFIKLRDKLRLNNSPHVRRYRIVKSLLPVSNRRHRYMMQDGRLDYLGQILTQMGYNVDGKLRTPADLGKVIPPFTQPCRGKVVDSKITLDILSLDYAPSLEHQQRLTDILAKQHIRLVWEI